MREVPAVVLVAMRREVVFSLKNFASLLGSFFTTDSKRSTLRLVSHGATSHFFWLRHLLEPVEAEIPRTVLPELCVRRFFCVKI